jgi:hypothetical protein
MDRNFEWIWADLRERLPSARAIRNWSADKGDLGREFRINHVEAGAIVVGPPNPAQERRISKSEFGKVYRDWEGYKTGSISRAELGERTNSQNTTYIISVLHWRETTSI